MASFTPDDFYISPEEFVDACSVKEKQELMDYLCGVVTPNGLDINDILKYIYKYHASSSWRIDVICDALQEMKKGWCPIIDHNAGTWGP